MNARALPSAEVIRLPVRPRLRAVAEASGEVLAAGGFRAGKAGSTSGLRVLAAPRPARGLTALDTLLAAGTLDARQHAAAVAYTALRRRYERSGGPMRSWRDRSGLSDEAWKAVKHDHAGLLRAAGAERFVLDRLCLEDDAPMACEMERVRAALERVEALELTTQQGVAAHYLGACGLASGLLSVIALAE